MKCILGKKKHMGQVWKADGTVVPVTYVEAGPCQVVQVKSKEKDGYAAIQLGFGAKKKGNKPLLGHTKDLPIFAAIREFRDDGSKAWTRGEVVNASTFAVGDKIDVVGTSKGKGFQGVVKRHGFAGHPTTHGHKDQERMPGSIGAGGVQRVFKGRRMAGRMGGDRVTVKNLEVVAVDAEKNLIAIRGAVPGAFNSLIMVKGA